MAKEETADQIASKTFWVTLIGAILFIGTSFAFVTFPSSGP